MIAKENADWSRDMTKIQTVLGEICESELGLIAPHEHIFIDTTFEAITPKSEKEREFFDSPVSLRCLDVLRRNPFLVRDNMVLDDMELAVSELERLRAVGCNTVVDLTSVGLGRNLAKIKEVSKTVGVNVIAGCGLYTGLTVGEPYKSMTAERIAALMIDEIQNGDIETGIKPGVIGEIGTSEVLCDIEMRSLYAAAFANLETRLPIYLHTYPWSKSSLEAVDILIKEGVKPSQICVCHLDVKFDEEYLETVLNKGVYAMLDNFGKEYYFTKQEAAFAGGPFETDIDRVRMIIKLLRKGYGERLLLATDVCLKSLLHAFGGWSYDHIFTNIVPMMENEGIGAEDIETMIFENPRRFICSR